MFTLAVSGCATSTPKTIVRHDAKLDLYNATARLEFDDGRPAEAADAYALALDRATVIDDPAACAAAAYSLAITRAAAYDYAGAITACDVAMYDARRVNLDPTDILLVRARVDLLRENRVEASSVADQVLSEPRSKATPIRQAQAHVIKGLAACRTDNDVAAANELATARQLAAGDSSPAMAAMLVGLSGEIHVFRKDAKTAAMEFDQQAQFSRKARDFRTMCLSLAKAGRAYRDMHDDSTAADRLYLAARAAVAGDSRDAAALVAEAVAAANKSHDAQLINLTNALKLRVHRP